MGKFTLRALGKFTLLISGPDANDCGMESRHTACINNNVIYLFGGADLEQRTNELYSFDPFTNNWTEISPLNTSRSDQPAPRSGAHSLSFENSIFFFGGYTRKGGVYFNDLTEFKTIQKKWVNLNPQNAP